MHSCRGGSAEGMMAGSSWEVNERKHSASMSLPLACTSFFLHHTAPATQRVGGGEWSSAGHSTSAVQPVH